jgi:hypothetical protein
VYGDPGTAGRPLSKMGQDRFSASDGNPGGIDGCVFQDAF